MGFICAICRESLDHQPDGTPIINSDNYDVVSTSCGHLFHFPCLEGCTNKKECPMCRKKYKTTKLYPTEVDREDETLVSAELELKVIELTSQVKDLNNEKKVLTSTYYELESENTILLNQFVTLKDSQEKATELAQTLQVKVDAYKKFRELSRMQEKEIRDLKTNMTFYDSIKKSIENGAVDVEEEYTKLNKNKETIKILLHSQNMLKSKIQSLKQENKEIKAKSIANFNKFTQINEQYIEMSNYAKKKEEEYSMFINKKENRETSSAKVANFLNRTPDASETSPIFSSGINFKRKPSQLSLEKDKCKSSSLSLKRTSQDLPNFNYDEKKSKIEDKKELRVTERLISRRAVFQRQKESVAHDDDIPFFVKQSIPLLGRARVGPTTKDGKKNPFYNFKITDSLITELL